VLGQPDDLRPEQAEAVAAAVRRFHALPLAAQLQLPSCSFMDDEQPTSSSSEHRLPLGFRLRGASLMRDDVWWMTEAANLGTWSFADAIDR